MSAAEDLNQKAINKSIYAATNEVARYYSERIARTEISRAWSDGFYAQTYDDSDVVGYRWDLSSRHPVYDICDFHANANLYGLGRGTYPKDKMPPHPAHPHCMCNLSEVIDGEFDGLKRNDKIDSSGEKYLKSLTEGERDALMGYKGNEAFKQGNDWRRILNNWKGHDDPNPRLKRSDFELNKKVISGRELPIKNEPNSVLDLRVKDGIIIRRRLFDETGNVKLDIDFSFHGNSKEHPQKLHAHDWLPKEGHQSWRLLTESEKKLIKDLWGDGE